MKSMNHMIVEQSLNTCNTAKQYESLAPLPDKGRWIEWKGGECPVPAGTLVDLRYRSDANGEKFAVPALTSGKMSGNYFWKHHSFGCDIIAWRLHQPEQAAWNGQGLPPVGTECEWLDGNTRKWFPVLVRYQSSWAIVIQEIKEGEEDPVELAIDVHLQDRRVNFRPIRTEEERKRDEAISAIDRIISSIYDQDTALSQVIYIAIAAGEIPGVKLEG